MGKVNVKNYYKQGGDEWHIGGKVVIDPGADLRALKAALDLAGKVKTPDPQKLFGDKKALELIDPTTYIGADGVVHGKLFKVESYSSLGFSDTNTKYYFPLILGNGGKLTDSKKVSCQRVSGDTEGKKVDSDELEWVLALTNGPDTVFRFWGAGTYGKLDLKFSECEFSDGETPYPKNKAPEKEEESE